MTTDAIGRLTLPAGPLQEAFERLEDLLPRKSIKTAELVLRFSAETLLVEGPGATVDVPATGVWPGRARVSASFTRLLATSLPDGDPLVLEFTDGRLVLRGATTIRFKAAWEDISPRRVDVALDLSDAELLKVRNRETSAAITSSGLGKLADGAERRFQHAVDLAYTPLSEYAFSRDAFERSVRSLITGS